MVLLSSEYKMHKNKIIVMYIHVLQQLHSINPVYKQRGGKCKVRKGQTENSSFSSQEGRGPIEFTIVRTSLSALSHFPRRSRISLYFL